MKQITVVHHKHYPAGGFVLVSVVELCMVWTAFRLGRIKLRDLRTWLACREMLARRSAAAHNVARYELHELHRLIGGVGGKHLERSLFRLESNKLVRWSASAITPTTSLDELDTELREAVGAMLAVIANTRRRIPVPRRMLRFLAAGTGRALAATAFAHLIRCLYGRSDGCRAVGTCKASWIADVFRVNERAVKRARAQLIAAGWLLARDSLHWHRNRFGLQVEINLQWQATEKTPAPCLSTTKKSPPESNNKLLTEYKNQKPAGHGAAGVGTERESGSPNLRHILPEDLRDPLRLEALFVQASARGIVQGSECERLAFFSAAEHAISVGTRNAPGLFNFVVRRRLWHFCTQREEDAARKKLNALAESTSRQKTCTVAQNGIQGMLANVLQSWAERRPRREAA